MNGISSAIFGLAGGVAFILLGRWIYSNPKQAFYIRSLYTDPDSSFLRVGAKIIGTFFIAGGSCAAVVIALGSLMNPNSTAWLILPLGAAVLSGWLLRPRTVEAPRAVAEPAAATRDGLLTPRRKLLIAWAFGGGGIFTAAVAVLLLTGESRLIPVVVMVSALVMVFALTAVLWM